jgi:hypothetical protein
MYKYDCLFVKQDNIVDELSSPFAKQIEINAKRIEIIAKRIEINETSLPKEKEFLHVTSSPRPMQNNNPSNLRRGLICNLH